MARKYFKKTCITSTAIKCMLSFCLFLYLSSLYGGKPGSNIFCEANKSWESIFVKLNKNTIESNGLDLIFSSDRKYDFRQERNSFVYDSLFVDCVFDESMSSDADQVNKVIQKELSRDDIEYAVFKYQNYYFKRNKPKGKLIREIEVHAINISKKISFTYSFKFSRNNSLEKTKVKRKTSAYNETYQMLRLASEKNIPCLDQSDLLENCGPVDDITGLKECIDVSHSRPDCIGFYKHGKFTRICALNNNYMLEKFPGAYPDKLDWSNFNKVLMDFSNSSR